MKNLGYEASVYYQKQEKLVDMHFDHKITEDELDEKLLEALEEELAHPEIYGTWLVYHYNSAAETLADGECDGEIAEKLNKIAQREAEIFEKYGYKNVADRIRRDAASGMSFLD